MLSYHHDVMLHTTHYTPLGKGDPGTATFHDVSITARIYDIKAPAYATANSYTIVDFFPLASPDRSEHSTAVTDVGRHEQVAHQNACRDRGAVLPTPILLGLLQNFCFGRGKRRSKKPLNPLRRFSPEPRPRSRLGHVRVELNSSSGKMEVHGNGCVSSGGDWGGHRWE